MAITKKVLDELLKEYRGPDDITGPVGLLKRLTKALIERAMEVNFGIHPKFCVNCTYHSDTRSP